MLKTKNLNQPFQTRYCGVRGGAVPHGEELPSEPVDGEKQWLPTWINSAGNNLLYDLFLNKADLKATLNVSKLILTVLDVSQWGGEEIGFST